MALPGESLTRILIAPNAFKGTLPASVAAERMARAIRRAGLSAVELLHCPIADGGDGTLAALRGADPGFVADSVRVTGPVPSFAVEADYLYHRARCLAVVEAAQAHGLALLETLSPMAATSYGVGELVRAVARRHPGLETLVVALGGSASTDGGAGALQALGARFYAADESGERLWTVPIGGRDLPALRRVEWPDWRDWPAIRVATDVTNPLLGPSGSARVFAPQKGASADDCARLEAGLANLARCFAQAGSLALPEEPGAGAAGGLGFGLRQLPGSRIVSGFDWLAEQVGLPGKVRAADLILTGEGRLDATSLSGKGVGSLIRLADGRPVWVLCGEAEPGLVLPDSVRVFSMARVMGTAQAAMARPEAALDLLLREIVLEIVRLF